MLAQGPVKEAATSDMLTASSELEGRDPIGAPTTADMVAVGRDIATADTGMVTQCEK